MDSTKHAQLEARNTARRQLRAWMKGRITSQELARDLRFSPVYISYIRTGKRDISDAFKWRFTARYGPATAAQVFGLSHSPAPAPDDNPSGNGQDPHLAHQPEPVLA